MQPLVLVTIFSLFLGTHVWASENLDTDPEINNPKECTEVVFDANLLEKLGLAIAEKENAVIYRQILIETELEKTLPNQELVRQLEKKNQNDLTTMAFLDVIYLAALGLQGVHMCINIEIEATQEPS